MEHHHHQFLDVFALSVFNRTQPPSNHRQGIESRPCSGGLLKKRNYPIREAEALFTILYFLRNLRMGPVSLNFCSWQAFSPDHIIFEGKVRAYLSEPLHSKVGTWPSTQKLS